MKKTNADISGLVLAAKPAGLSSTGLVAMVRKTLGGVRTGHSGTLDRFASGLMVLAVGQATSVAEVLLGMDKEYEAVFELGRSTDTQDPEGSVLDSRSPAETEAFVAANADRIRTAFLAQQGQLLQIPPQYSALKKDGRRASDYARQGVTIELAGRAVHIESRIASLSPQGELRAWLKVSSGTYIRSVARDLGQALDYPVLLRELSRSRVGPFSLADAWVPPEGQPQVLSVLSAFPDWPRLPVSAESARRIRQGGFVPIPELRPGQNFFFVRDSLIAWGVAGEKGQYRYRRVFHQD